MSSLLINLQAKTEKIRSWYRKSYENYATESPAKLAEEEKKLLESAMRWHINSHIRFSAG